MMASRYKCGGFIGPLFWPYAYDDFLNYTFYPYAHDAFTLVFMSAELVVGERVVATANGVWMTLGKG